MFKFLSQIPAGFRKFTIVFIALIIFLILSLFTFFIEDGSIQSIVIAAIAAGLVSIITVFFKYNKDIHVSGKSENTGL